jgi:geranylgeranyl pyrophosphate synthase
MRKRLITCLILTAVFNVIISAALIKAEDIEARIIKVTKEFFGPTPTKEKLISSLVELLEITNALTASSQYAKEIKHHIDVAKDLFKNTSIFNEKARQYLKLAYRMVTEGKKFQEPAELEEFITPSEAIEKSKKYIKNLVNEACASVKQCDKNNAARLLLEVVILIVSPMKG